MPTTQVHDGLRFALPSATIFAKAHFGLRVKLQKISERIAPNSPLCPYERLRKSDLFGGALVLYPVESQLLPHP